MRLLITIRVIIVIIIIIIIIIIIAIIIITIIIIIMIIINFIAPHNNIRQLYLLKSSKFSLSHRLFIKNHSFHITDKIL